MTDEPTSSDHLHAAIKSLRGWYYLLENAEDEYDRARRGRPAGQVISSILLAGGEDTTPIAVSGELDDAQSGHLTIVYADRIVIVDAETLWGDAASYTTRVRFFDDISDLRVETRHSHYDGTDTHPRTRGFEVSFAVDGERVQLGATKWAALRSPLVEDQAIYAAYVAICDRKATR
jgi:hypothetical protein